jgi:hypothetical protein
MRGLDLAAFHQAIKDGRVEWRLHVLQRMAERGIAQADVLNVLLSGDRIENYPAAKPFSKALFLGFVGKNPLHVVAAFDKTHSRAYIVTAYEPSPDVFEADFRTRK